MVLSNVENPESYKRISISEFNSLTRCTAQHDYLYRQGLKKLEQATYFSKGSYFHSLMEQYHRDPENFNLDAASTEAKIKLMEERESIVQEADALEINALMAKWVQDNPEPSVLLVEDEPAVELEFYADIGLRNIGGETVLLYGFIDAVLVNDGGNLVVVEHKTAGRAWSQVQLQQNYQAPIYAHVIETLLPGVDVDEVRFNFFYPKSTAVQSIYPTQEHKEALVQELQAGVWLRDTGSVVKSPLWGCNGCPVRSYCLLEMQGRDASVLVGTEFTIDEEKAARFAEGDE